MILDTRNTKTRMGKMFRYSFLIDSLLKAMTHKYIRRVPKGVTTTGKTKYMYFYAGQEGHGKGIAHESELVVGASFAFGEHGKTRYHAHISKVDGDKVTVKYDDGAKKGTEETMTKKQFQSMIHGEHSTSIQSAKEKATKQLKDFQAGKEKGVKVKQETLDKLEQRVKNLDQLTAKKEDAQKPEAPLKMIKDYFADAFARTNPDLVSVIKHFTHFVEQTNRPMSTYAPIKIKEEMLDGVLHINKFDRIFDRYVINAFKELLDKNNAVLQSSDMLSEFGRPIIKDLADLESIHGGIFDDIEKTFKTKKMRTDLLLTIANNVENGVVDPKDIGRIIEKKFMEEGQKFIDDAKEKVTAPQKMVKVKPIKPSEQNAKDLVTSLYSFADKAKGHRLNSITINPMTKTIFATDRSMALIVTNPKGFEFSDDIKKDNESVALNATQISNMKKTKSPKIVLNASNTDENLGFENQRIESILMNIYDNGKKQKTMTFTEDLRDKLASLKDYTNAKVVFSQSPTDKTQFEVYHRFGTFGAEQNVKIGDVALGQGVDTFAEEFAIRADQLKQALPMISKIYIPATPTTAISFDGNDENTRGMVVPINIRRT